MVKIKLKYFLKNAWIFIILLSLSSILWLSFPSCDAALRISPHQDFFSISTPKLEIIFPASLRNYVPEIVEIGETTIEKLENTFHSTLTPKPQIVILDSSVASNAFAYTLWQKIIVLSAYPADHLSGTHFGNWFKLVLTHELAHLFQGGIIPQEELWGKMLGKVIPPGALQPAWFKEGYAIYMESTLNDQGRLQDPLFEMYWREETANGLKNPSLFGGYGYTDEWPGSLGCYVYGASLCAYIVERFGAETLQKIVIYQNRTANPFDLARAVKKATGITLNQLFRDWEKYMLEKTTTQSPATQIKFLTNKGFYTRGLTIAPDGMHLVYSLSHPRFLPGLRMLALSSNQEKLLITGEIKGRASFSDDGQKVIYSKRVEGKYRDYVDIFMYDFQKKQEKRMTQYLRALSPLFLNNHKILFLSREPAQKGIFVLDLDNQEIVPVYSFPSSFHPIEMVISPDKKLLAISGWHYGYADIALLELEEGCLRFLTQDQAADLYPSFSENGKYLCFSSDRNGKYDLYAYSLENGAFFRLTDVASGVFDSILCKDATYTVAYHAGGYEVGKINKLLWQKIRLTKEPLPEVNTMSPDKPFSTEKAYQPLKHLRFRILPQVEGVKLESQDPLEKIYFSLNYNFSDVKIQYINRAQPVDFHLSVQSGKQDEWSFGASLPVITQNRQGVLKLSLIQKPVESSSPSHHKRGLLSEFATKQYGGNDAWIYRESFEGSWFVGYCNQEPGSELVLQYTKDYVVPTKNSILSFSLAEGQSSFEDAFAIGDQNIPLKGHPQIRGKNFLYGEISLSFPLKVLYLPLGNTFFIKDLRGKVYLQGASIANENFGEEFFAIGGELNARAFLGNDSIPLLLTTGLSYPISREGKPEFYLSLDTSF
ncbi:hypothetical protein [Atrimonas thermophila]|uniref:hypothetical protein n=1 Tax=Atrimonas thermophila TaxID=3064161 RepID=UPI00399C95A1